MSEPITASEAGVYLRLDGAGDSPLPEVDLLERLITAARQSAEDFINRTIASRQLTLILDSFTSQTPGIVSEIIDLPFGDVSSVDEIAYIDADGANQTVASFILSQDMLTPAFGETWPATRAQLGAVTITYTAGYIPTGSPAVSTVPGPVVQAIYLILNDMYENREALSQGQAYQVNPSAINLLQPYRINMGV